MPIDDIMSRNHPRRPALRGSLQLDIVNGQERARAWPKKRGRPKSALTREQVDTFRQCQWAIKYWPPEMQKACAEAVAGTPLLPRDLMTMIMYGRFVQVGYEDGGRDLYSMAQLNDVSQSLDVISSTPGDTLVRGAEYWQGVPFSGGGGGSTANLIPWSAPRPDMLANSANFGSPALALVPAYCDGYQILEAVNLPLRGTLSGLKAFACLYGGLDPATTPPQINGLGLLATGPDVSLTTANRVYRLDFTVPYTLTAGKMYYVGWAFHGASGNVQLGITAQNVRTYYSTAGYTSAPSALPGMTLSNNNNAGIWTA